MLSPDDEINPSEDKPMIQVSAFPTVEWLRSRAADRPPVSRAGRRLTGMSDRTRHLDSDTERSLGSVPTPGPGPYPVG